MKDFFKKFVPLKYDTDYVETKTGKKIVCIWNMWFGKCYNVKHYEVVS